MTTLWFTAMHASRALRQGQKLLENQDFELACGLCQRAVDLAPQWYIARLWLASACSELGDLDRAREHLLVACELKKDSLVPRLWLGRILLDHGDSQEAYAVLNALTEGKEKNVLLSGYQSLAAWAASSGERAETTVPVSLAGGAQLLGRGLLLAEERFPGGPGTDFFVAPTQPRRWTERADAARAGRLVRRAERALREANYIKALALLERADSLGQGNDQRQELSISAHHGAAQARQAQLAGPSDSVDVRLALAFDLLALGDFREALRVLQPVDELIERFGPHRLSWRAASDLLRGRALLEVRQLASAVVALKRAHGLWPWEVEPLYYVGVAYLRLGNRAAARRAFVAACELDAGIAEVRLRELQEALRGESETVSTAPSDAH